MKGKTGKTLKKLIPEPHGPQQFDHRGGEVKKKHGGKVGGEKPEKRADKFARGGKAGIHIKASHKGLLRKDTGTAGGKKIPETKIKKAEKSKDPAVRKRAVFAENAKHWNHG